MSRIVQGVKSRGSQRWLQIVVNRCRRVIDRAIRGAGIDLPEAIEWLSPLEGDGFAEYRDAAFLERLGIRLDRRTLGEFWPARGPVWDGLAHSGERLLLVEAKAHVGEIDSSPTAAGSDSRTMIEAALAERDGRFLASGRAATGRRAITSTPIGWRICICCAS